MSLMEGVVLSRDAKYFDDQANEFVVDNMNRAAYLMASNARIFSKKVFSYREELKMMTKERDDAQGSNTKLNLELCSVTKVAEMAECLERDVKNSNDLLIKTNTQFTDEVKKVKALNKTNTELESAKTKLALDMVTLDKKSKAAISAIKGLEY